MNLRLHHIGILVKNIKKSAAEYVSRFGYRVKSHIIHDPVQTAWVQFLELNHEASYVELISPDSNESKLSNALKKGGGLNHLCYETDDIYKTYREFESQRMLVLQHPVVAVAFPGRMIAWLIGRDGIPVELVEKGDDKWDQP